MNIEIKMLEPGIAIAVLSGSFDPKAALAALRQFQQSEDSRTSRAGLIDLSECDFSEVSSETMRQYALERNRTMQESADERPIAVVAPENVAFGLSKMVSAFNNVAPVHVVRTREAALEWLRKHIGEIGD